MSKPKPTDEFTDPKPPAKEYVWSDMLIKRTDDEATRAARKIEKKARLINKSAGKQPERLSEPLDWKAPNTRS